MTLLENVVIGAFVNAPTDTDARATASAVLARLGLAAKNETPAGELTNYELRLMELARALASKPRLLLLDEPFAGLAAPEIASFMDIIRSLRAEGLTVVIIEHTMQAMVKLVDRFIVLDHGEVIANGPPRDVIANADVIKAYLGDNWGADAVA
jgi:branched-chain amino acid transport system permease protein